MGNYLGVKDGMRSGRIWGEYLLYMYVPALISDQRCNFVLNIEVTPPISRLLEGRECLKDGCEDWPVVFLVGVIQAQTSRILLLSK